ncbi:MAG: hypothetical protein H6772_01415 [Pseudomonadales bacterium]|nr:hypothetical protein [Pseudomonadales bacterium]
MPRRKKEADTDDLFKEKVRINMKKGSERTYQQLNHIIKLELDHDTVDLIEATLNTGINPNSILREINSALQNDIIIDN